MIDQVAAAFERKDYRTAESLLQQLLKESPQNPWGQLYLGRLHEVSGKLSAAQKVYQQLLRSTINAKVGNQARQGLQRLEAIEQEQRQRAKAQAAADPTNAELGLLVLEPVASEDKIVAA